MKRWWVAAALSLAGTVAFAQAPSAPQGEPDAGAALRDRDFGVTTDRFGLDRRVEMYQWRADDSGYRRVWNAAPIDSSGFSYGHENPPAIPLESRRWWARDATLDGRPIDPTVLKTLGRWQDFRPGFSRLPANLAATFQPDGDGLSSSENPLAPEVGDLRVTWRELVLPPLAGKVELRDGRWQLAPRTRVPAAAAAPRAAIAAPEPSDPPVEHASWPWLLGGVVLVVLGLAWWRRRRG